MNEFNINDKIAADFNFSNIIGYSVKSTAGKLHKEVSRINHGFVYVISGVFNYELNDYEIIRSYEDSIVYLPKNSTYFHIAQCDSQTIVVNFDLTAASAEFSFSEGICLLNFVKSKTLRADFINLYDEYYSSGNPAKLKRYLYNIILRIYDEYKYKMNKNDKRYAMIQPAIEFLETNNVFDTHVRELSDMCYLSQNAFRNIFKEYYNMLPNEYLIKRRLDRAVQLLKNTNLSITDIAEQLNFTDTAHFSNSFKKYMNITPNMYR